MHLIMSLQEERAATAAETKTENNFHENIQLKNVGSLGFISLNKLLVYDS